MQKRRKPVNYFRWLFWLVLIGVFVYINSIADTIPVPWVPTPTPTRDPESVVSEAKTFFDKGKLPQSISAYQEAVRARPNDASLYLSLARVQLFAGLYPAAQVSAENALLLNPNNATAHALRGAALAGQGDTLPAEAAIKRALELDGNNALAHAFYAELLANQYVNGTGALDVIDRMSEESRTAVNLDPGMIETNRARGLVLYATTNYEESIRSYQAAIAINPNLAELHLAMGRNYRAMQVYDKAIDELALANSINPSDPTPDYLIARIYATVGEKTKAEQFAEQAVKDAPSDPFWHGTLGVMYYQNFKYQEAVTQLSLTVNGGKLEDGTEVKPLELTNELRITEYYFTYGLVLARLGRCGEALPISTQILQKLPNDEIASYNAQEIVRICNEAAGTPAATDTPEGTPEATPTP